MAIRMNGLSLELLSHPGETLKEVLDSNNMTQKELSARIGITPKHLNLIISGKQDISTETAFKLEKVFSLSASFWNNLQRQYDEDKMSILEEQQIFEEEKSVYDANVYSQIVALGYLQRETSGTHSATVRCKKCYARGSTASSKAGKNIYSASEEAKNKAIELWNRRYLE